MMISRVDYISEHLEPAFRQGYLPPRFQRRAARLAERVGTSLAAHVYGVYPQAVTYWREKHSEK